MDAGADLRLRRARVQREPVELGIKGCCRAGVLQAARLLDVGVCPAALQPLLGLVPGRGKVRIRALVA